MRARSRCDGTDDSIDAPGKGIPEHILRLPNEVLDSPAGQILGPMLTSMEDMLRSTGDDFFGQHRQGTSSGGSQPASGSAGRGAPNSAPGGSGQSFPLPVDFESIVADFAKSAAEQLEELAKGSRAPS